MVWGFGYAGVGVGVWFRRSFADVVVNEGALPHQLTGTRRPYALRLHFEVVPDFELRGFRGLRVVGLLRASVSGLVQCNRNPQSYVSLPHRTPSPRLPRQSYVPMSFQPSLVLLSRCIFYCLHTEQYVLLRNRQSHGYHIVMI